MFVLIMYIKQMIMFNDTMRDMAFQQLLNTCHNKSIIVGLNVNALKSFLFTFSTPWHIKLYVSAVAC